MQSAAGNTSDIGSTAPTLAHVVPAGDGSVFALSSLGNRLFVSRYPCQQQIQVYDTETFVRQQPLRVAGLGDTAYGLVVCAVNNCLYVSDRYDGAVYRVELTGDNTVSKWQVGSCPTGLSVNNDARKVLVTCCDLNAIQEYTTRGSLVREIRLQSDVASPWHSLQLTSGQYLVSHLGPVDGISVVDVDGQLVVGYRNTPGSPTRLLSRPRQLAVDTKGCIVVADQLNNRIVVLDPALACARGLPMSVEGGLTRPWSVCFDESRDRLYVGECDLGRITVWNNVALCQK